MYDLSLFKPVMWIKKLQYIEKELTYFRRYFLTKYTTRRLWKRDLYYITLKLDDSITFAPLKEQHAWRETKSEVTKLREGHEEEGNEN